MSRFGGLSKNAADNSFENNLPLLRELLEDLNETVFDGVGKIIETPPHYRGFYLNNYPPSISQPCIGLELPRGDFIVIGGKTRDLCQLVVEKDGFTTSWRSWGSKYTDFDLVSNLTLAVTFLRS